MITRGPPQSTGVKMSHGHFVCNKFHINLIQRFLTWGPRNPWGRVPLIDCSGSVNVVGEKKLQLVISVCGRGTE